MAKMTPDEFLIKQAEHIDKIYELMGDLAHGCKMMAEDVRILSEKHADAAIKIHHLELLVSDLMGANNGKTLQ